MPRQLEESEGMKTLMKPIPLWKWKSYSHTESYMSLCSKQTQVCSLSLRRAASGNVLSTSQIANPMATELSGLVAIHVTHLSSLTSVSARKQAKHTGTPRWQWRSFVRSILPRPKEPRRLRSPWLHRDTANAAEPVVKCLSLNLCGSSLVGALTPKRGCVGYQFQGLPAGQSGKRKC